MGSIEQKATELTEQMREHQMREILTTFKRIRTRDRELREIIKENPEAEIILPKLDRNAEEAEHVLQ